MKQNHMFKKTMALMMALLLLGLAGCTGPKRTGETIDIITDEGKKTVPLIRLVTDVYWDQTNLNSALRTVPGNGREFHVSFEPLPRDEPARDNYLTRMRAEMMAGKGPDVFLMDMTCSFKSLSANSGKLLDPLFRFPEQAMDNRLFLPLDEYMEASSTNYDAFRADLMEACSNEEGQQILPLTYAVDTVPLKEGTYDFPEESTLTQQGMLESGDLRLEYYASFLNHMPLQYFVPGTASGSINAAIETWCAVSNTTKHPEDAFFIADILLSYDFLKQESLWSKQPPAQKNSQSMPFFWTAGESLVPVHTGLLSGKGSYKYNEGLIPARRAAIKNARENIGYAYFTSNVDREIDHMSAELFDKARQGESLTGDDIRKAADKTYTTMKMMLAES